MDVSFICVCVVIDNESDFVVTLATLTILRQNF